MNCMLALILVFLGLLLGVRLPAEEAVHEPAAETAADTAKAEPAVETEAAARQPTLADLVRNGDAAPGQPQFEGFGNMGLLGASLEIKSQPPYAWKDEAGRKTLKVESYSAELWQVPGEWAAVRKLLPVPGEKDMATSRKLFWNGVSAWRLDYTPAKTPADGGGTRQRYLVAPVGAGFLVLGFKGDPAKFAADRPQMERVALGVQFVVNGLISEYCNGRELAPDKVYRLQVDPIIDFPWNEAGPGDGIGPDNFTVRWTGRLRAPATATYTLTTASDDGVRLWLDDTPLIDNWTDHATTDDKAAVELEEGKEYAIRLEWYEAGGGAVIQLFWETPDMERTIIPATSMLSRPEPGFREVPRPQAPAGQEEVPPGMPPPLFGKTPGNYWSSPSGLAWTGKRPKQTMTLGAGASAVQVTLQRSKVDIDKIRSLLPSGPDDKVEIFPLLFNDVRAWRAECKLASGRFMRVYLIPLKQGAAVSLCLEAAGSNWSQQVKDSVLVLIDSLTFSPEVEEEDAVEAGGSVGPAGTVVPDPPF